MLVYLTGGILFLSCTIVSYYTGKIDEEKDNKPPEEILDNGIIRIPYRAEDITFSMLNNPNDPNYIGHLFKSSKKGAEYNL